MAGDGTGHQALCKQAGISYRQLNHWITQGYVPGAPGSPGTGHARSFSAATRRRVITLGRLVNAGFSAPVAAELAADLERTGTIDFGNGLALMDFTFTSQETA